MAWDISQGWYDESGNEVGSDGNPLGLGSKLLSIIKSLGKGTSQAGGTYSNTGTTVKSGMQGLGSGLMSTGNPYAAAVGGALTLASLFMKSPEGYMKEMATKNQQELENFAKDVQQKVNSGQMDADIAIGMLNKLVGSQGSGANQYESAGLAKAQYTIQQVLANIKQDRMWKVNAPYSPGENTSGTNTFQKDRTAALLHSGLLGGEATKNMTSANAPLAKLWEPHQDVGEGFAKYYDQMDKLNPDPRKSTAYTQLGEALRNQIKRFGG